MPFDLTKYAELLSAAKPCVIDSDEELKRIKEIFEPLLDKGKDRTPEEDKLFDLLAILMENYDRRDTEQIRHLTPAEFLRHLMCENNLKQKDLADIFGGQSVVSLVLCGRRQITISQAKKLGERFSVVPSAFI